MEKLYQGICALIEYHEHQKYPGKKRWKYANPELERRFLLEGKPEIIEACPSKLILDKYLHGTSLRLRKLVAGKETVYKLTKKIPLGGGQNNLNWVSTIYLSATEYEIFQSLNGIVTEKKRFYYQKGSNETIGIDEIKIQGETIWLAEVEFNKEEDLKRFKFPLEYEKEVSDNERYTGYELAKLANQI